MTVTMSFDPDVELIASAYGTEDDIGKVLRTHLAVERMIEQLIRTQSRASADARTTFSGKINLLRAMRVPEKICAASENINKLRNKFAHDSNATVASTMTISQNFLAAVTNIVPILPKSHGTISSKTQGIHAEFSYAEASQAQRIVIAAAFLSAIIGGLPKLLMFQDPPTLTIVRGVEL